MSERLEELAAEAASNIRSATEATCPKCRRGAWGAPVPVVEDLEAMIEIRDGFNNLRRQFTPEVEERFRRFDNVISYVHRLIVGTENG